MWPRDQDFLLTLSPLIVFFNNQIYKFYIFESFLLVLPHLLGIPALVGSKQIDIENHFLDSFIIQNFYDNPANEERKPQMADATGSRTKSAANSAKISATRDDHCRLRKKSKQ